MTFFSGLLILQPKPSQSHPIPSNPIMTNNPTTTSPQTEHKNQVNNGDLEEQTLHHSFDRQQWAAKVRSPFLISLSCGVALGCLSSIAFHGGSSLMKTMMVQGLSFGVVGFSYFGTREFLDMRWKRLEMVESLTMSSVLGGFVAGGVYRALVVPVINMEEVITKDMAEVAKKLTTEEHKQLKHSLRRVALRPVLGFALIGAGLALAISKSQEWWALYKHGKLERLKTFEQVIQRAEKEEILSHEMLKEIEKAERAQDGFFKRKWGQFVGMLSFEIPEWIRRDNTVSETVKHKEEMEHIYQEFEKMKAAELALQKETKDQTKKKE